MKKEKEAKLNLNRDTRFSKDKLVAIKKACKLTDKLYSDVMKRFSMFETEKDVSKFMDGWMKERKLKSAFPTIVASGKNAYEIHHKPVDSKLQKGFCYLDFGIRVEGYCSDMTRTIFIGNPTIGERRLYKLLLDAQKLGIDLVKVGRKYSEIDIQVRKFLGRYKKYFIHSLGHGLGKWIHCMPRISPRSNDVVKDGDIITIEPGIYIKNRLGIRIEDDIYVCKRGVEILNKSTKKLVCFRLKR
jgi:Xaa-Pro aminopeptidase